MENATSEANRIIIPGETVVHQPDWNTLASVEAIPSETTSPKPQPSPSTADVIWLPLLLSGVMVTIPCIFVIVEIWTHWQRWKLNGRLDTSIPCKNCYFFAKNLQLRCAVHPCTVLTEAAVDCPDYRPKKAEISFRKPSSK